MLENTSFAADNVLRCITPISIKIFYEGIKKYIGANRGIIPIGE